MGKDAVSVMSQETLSSPGFEERISVWSLVTWSFNEDFEGTTPVGMVKTISASVSLIWAYPHIFQEILIGFPGM